MDKHQSSKTNHGERRAQASLDSLRTLFDIMSHTSNAMEIIGIADPADAEALLQKTGDHNRFKRP